MKFVNYLKDSLLNIIKGMFIGVANVIPGVSGGTMAVSFGIYDKLIESVTNLLKKFKKSVAFLFPILLGAGLGIVAFSYLIKFLLDKQTLPTDLAFIGLIFGGLPIIFNGLREKQKEKGLEGFKIRPQDVIAFLIFFGLAIVLPLLKGNDDQTQQLAPTFANVCLVFFGGVIAAATMIIPGVSGSMVMMILGFYYGVINLITDFFTALKAFDVKRCLELCKLLVPFGLGVLLGIFIIAKLIDHMFKKHGIVTYSAIFGLIVASPFAIIYNTDAFGKSTGVVQVVIGIVLMIGLGLGTYYIGRMGNEKE